MKITIEISAANYKTLQAEAEHRTVSNAPHGMPSWTAEDVLVIYGIMAVEAEIKKREEAAK